MGQARLRIGVRAALSALVALLALVLTGCSEPGQDPLISPPPEPQDPPEACSFDEPATEPGDAPLLFTLDVAGLVWVVYADGSALTHRQATDGDLDGGVLAAQITTPYQEGPGVWDNAYLTECDLQEVQERAEEFFAGDPQLDQIEVIDTAETILTYHGPQGAQSVGTMAIEAGGEGLPPDQQEDLAAMRELVRDLESAMRSDGTTAPVRAVQVETRTTAGEPAWSAPPLQEVLTEGCGVYTGADAVTVVRYLSELDEQPVGLRAQTLPPGIEGCAEAGTL